MHSSSKPAFMSILTLALIWINSLQLVHNSAAGGNFLTDNRQYCKGLATQIDTAIRALFVFHTLFVSKSNNLNMDLCVHCVYNKSGVSTPLLKPLSVLRTFTNKFHLCSTTVCMYIMWMRLHDARVDVIIRRRLWGLCMLDTGWMFTAYAFT